MQQAALEARDSWTAARHAVLPGWVDDDGTARLAVLSHPNYPYPDEVAYPADPDLVSGLRRIATAYLLKVRDTYRPVPQRDPALEAACTMLAEGAGRSGFGWLDIRWGGIAGTLDPRLSFWVERQQGGTVADRSVVLLAANQHRDDGKQRCEGLAVGLRVVMHLDPASADPQAPVAVRVTGLSASRLRLARPPAELSIERQTEQATWLSEAISIAEAAYGFAVAAVKVAAARFAPDGDEGLLVGTGRRGDDDDLLAGRARVFEWSARFGPDQAGARVWATGPLVELSSAAAAAVFERDPASQGAAFDEAARRPTAAEPALETYRATASAEIPLRDAANPCRFEVRQSIVADRDNDPASVQTVAKMGPADLRLRTDHQAAVHAFVRAQEFFDRLEAYGLTAASYFKLAQLPLLLRHRAWFFDQPDGLAVNAMVRPNRESPSLFEDYQPANTPQLEVRFGAANLEHRVLRDNDHGKARAQPLGIAADPRIAWHEFGHVLSYAATGALEFHFAHSAGDALAAIVADPGSALAAAAECRDGPGMAGLTFPWLQMPRRHDRAAQLGWCWCGRRDAMRRVPLRLPAPLFKGYAEEQMLSSTLFRLYRVLGGDCFSEPARRAAAADYCVYLVMRAIALLGPAAVVPALSAEAFAAALVDADAGTATWDVEMPATSDANPPRHHSRCGGTAHKVIRWAFELQGLYSADLPSEIVEGEGRPPAVDLYIPGQGARGQGGYAPVELGWQPLPPATAPAWHAGEAGLLLETDRVVVNVHNRGDLPAVGVTAHAWVAPVPPADGDDLAWQPLTPDGAGVEQGGVQPFRFMALDSGGQPLSGPHYVLAEAHCDDDRSNLNVDSLLACSGAAPPAQPARLVDLVANDNNLALRRLDFA